MRKYRLPSDNDSDSNASKRTKYQFKDYEGEEI